MEIVVKTKVQFAPILREFLTLMPLPDPRPITDWYVDCQAWCIKTHGFRPTRNQIAEQLGMLSYSQKRTRSGNAWSLDDKWS